MADYKPPIKAFPAAVLKVAFQIALAFTRKIEDQRGRKIIEGTFAGAAALTNALSDADPNDAAQIRAVVNQMLTSGDFYQGTRESLLATIEKIKADNIKTVLSLAVDQVYGSLRLLTDETTPNDEQLKGQLQAFVRSAAGLEFVTGLLEIAFDEQTAAIIGSILIGALRNLQAEAGTVMAFEEAAALDALEEKWLAIYTA